MHGHYSNTPSAYIYACPKHGISFEEPWASQKIVNTKLGYNTTGSVCPFIKIRFIWQFAILRKCVFIKLSNWAGWFILNEYYLSLHLGHIFVCARVFKSNLDNDFSWGSVFLFFFLFENRNAHITPQNSSRTLCSVFLTNVCLGWRKGGNSKP